MGKHRNIYTFLDIILIIGALVAVATINGGTWITDAVGFYQTNLVYQVEPGTRTLADTGGPSSEEGNAEAQSPCLINSSPGLREWAEVYMIQSAACEQGQLISAVPER